MRLKRLQRALAILSGGTFATLFLFVVCGQAQSRNTSLALGQFSESLQDLSARISPSVVHIVGTGFGFENDTGHAGVSVLSKQRNTGSGVIVSDDGYVVTNAHVVEGARSIRVKVTGSHNGRVSLFDARLVGIDRVIDLALLKIAATGLTPIPFGNSLKLKQGELVLAFGSPLGMDNSVSMGVVSAVARQLTEDDPRIYVVTVTEKPDDPQRFADMVNPADNLISTLGILGITVDDRLLKTLSLRVADGVLVAAHSGLSMYFGDQPQEGGVIHAVNGERIFSVEDLRSKLNRLKPTDPAVLQVERDGSLMFLVLESD